MSRDVVLTPGGFRDRSLVHQMPDGHALNGALGRMQMLNLATRAIIDIPHVAIAPEEVPALGSGWISYAHWNNGTGRSITSFLTTWVVPPAPATQGSQTIFLFNGIQNHGNNYGILQPVLQWGASAAGGGQYWSVASWYVTSGGQAFHTQLVQVNPGDTLVGVMMLTGQSGNLFNYTSSFQGMPNTTLPVQNIAELLWCNETLEAYSVNQCSDYPATDRTALRTINIHTGNVVPVLNWTPVNAVKDCGQHTVVIGNSATNGEVDIFYRAVNFKARPAVFPTNAPANKKSVYLLAIDDRLVQVWDTDHWNLDFPAEAAGQGSLRFQGSPSVFPTNAGTNKKSIYILTSDGRLAQVWDTDRWNLDFPAELAGQAALRFQGGPAVFPTNAGANKKSIYVITNNGRLAQVWDTNRWNLDFPAELAGQAGLRFKGGTAVFPTNAGANKKSIYALTSDGRLAQVWDTDRWNLDFPAEAV